MLVVISPAKKLNMDPIDSFVVTEPDFSMNVKELIDATRKLSVEDLQNLMGISLNLAKLNCSAGNPSTPDTPVLSKGTPFLEQAAIKVTTTNNMQVK